MKDFKPNDRVVFIRPHGDVRVGEFATVLDPPYFGNDKGNSKWVRIHLDKMRDDKNNRRLTTWPNEICLDYPQTKMDDTRSYLAAVTEGV